MKLMEKLKWDAFTRRNGPPGKVSIFFVCCHCDLEKQAISAPKKADMVRAQLILRDQGGSRFCKWLYMYSHLQNRFPPVTLKKILSIDPVSQFWCYHPCKSVLSLFRPQKF